MIVKYKINAKVMIFFEIANKNGIFVYFFVFFSFFVFYYLTIMEYLCNINAQVLFLWLR